MNSKQIKEGDLVECSFRSVFYPAKIVKVDFTKTAGPYCIHYQGWKKRWDEWVPETRFKGSSNDSIKAKESSANVLKKTDVFSDLKKINSKKPSSSLTPRIKQRGKASKAAKEEVDSSDDEPKPSVKLVTLAVQKANAASLNKKKTVKKRPLSSSPASNKRTLVLDEEKEGDDDAKVVEKVPTFERIVGQDFVHFKSSEGKTFKSLAELKKYFKQKKMGFKETDFDFSLPIPESKPLMPKITKKQSHGAKKLNKNKEKEIESSSEKLGPQEILDEIKQLQEVKLFAKKVVPIKRGRGRPPRDPNQEPKVKIQKRNESYTPKEPMEMEIAGDVSDNDTKTQATDKMVEFSLMETSSIAGYNELHASSSTDSQAFINPKGRPMRSKKPNQRYNVLLSEIDALERQGRRRRYSSKHSTASGDEMLSDSNNAEEEHPLLVKIGTPKKKSKREKKLSPSSPKRKKTGSLKKLKGELKLMSGTSSDFESAPEFVEIQARGHSPQEHDDGLPPVLGLSSDDRSIRSHSLDPLPLVDQMCDALGTSPTIETPPSMDHLISEFNSSQERMQHMITTESSAKDKKRVKKSGQKKLGKKSSVDDGSPLESFQGPVLSPQPKQRRKKEKKFYSADEEPPSITNEEIEEGLQTLEALEAQAMQGIKVSSLPSQPNLNLSPRSSQVVLKIKPTESRRGRARRSTNVEIPLLQRESESANDFNDTGLSTMGSPPQHQQQRQHQIAVDESTKFCYLPPEIMGDHCYGKSFPSTSFCGNASSAEAHETHLYNAEPVETVSAPLIRAARGRPARFDLMQRSPSPPPYKPSAFLGDPVGSYGYHRLDPDYGGNSGVGSSSVVLPASIMTGGQVPMLSDKLPANILEDDGDLNDDEEITAVDIS